MEKSYVAELLTQILEATGTSIDEAGRLYTVDGSGPLVTLIDGKEIFEILQALDVGPKGD